MKLKFRAKIASSLTAVAMAAVLSCALAGPASASVGPLKVLSFSYNFGGGNILSGSLSGTDAGNYFTVTGVTSLAVNGVSQAAFIPTATLYSGDAYVGKGSGHNGNNTPVVTVDGSYMDVVFTANGNDGFAFFVNDAYGMSSGNFAAYALPVGSATANPPVQSAYHTSLAVPETATWAMMLVGMSAIGLAMRRRATVTVSYT